MEEFTYHSYAVSPLHCPCWLCNCVSCAYCMCSYVGVQIRSCVLSVYFIVHFILDSTGFAALAFALPMKHH